MRVTFKKNSRNITTSCCIASFKGTHEELLASVFERVLLYTHTHTRSFSLSLSLSLSLSSLSTPNRNTHKHTLSLTHSLTSHSLTLPHTHPQPTPTHIHRAMREDLTMPAGCALKRIALLATVLAVSVCLTSSSVTPSHVGTDSEGRLFFADENQTTTLADLLSRLAQTEATISSLQQSNSRLQQSNSRLQRAVEDSSSCNRRARLYDYNTATCIMGSCAELFALNASLASGVYTIGLSNPIPTYCEMLPPAGGGWTLIAMQQQQQNDTDTTWDYDSDLWKSSTSTINPSVTDPNANTHMKNAHFSSMAFQKIKFVMSNSLTYPGTGTGINSSSTFIVNSIANNAVAFFGTALPTQFSRAAWINAVNATNSTVWNTEPNCNIEGSNQVTAIMKCRFCLQMNDLNQCSDNNAAIGWGVTATGARTWDVAGFPSTRPNRLRRCMQGEDGFLCSNFGEGEKRNLFLRKERGRGETSVFLCSCVLKKRHSCHTIKLR